MFVEPSSIPSYIVAFWGFLQKNVYDWGTEVASTLLETENVFLFIWFSDELCRGVQGINFITAEKLKEQLQKPNRKRLRVSQQICLAMTLFSERQLNLLVKSLSIDTGFTV